MGIACVLKLLALGFGALWQASVGDIPYPPNAVSGATVVALVTLDSGAVRRVDVVSGDEPFASIVRSSLAQWRFPDDPASKTVTVVVKYRQPGFYSLADTREDVPSPSAPARSVAYPKAVAEPSYPPNATGEGTVVLRVTVSAAGMIEKAETVQGVGRLTDAARDALRSWTFAPAHDKAGRPVASEAYAVFVFRSPVLSPPPHR